MLTTDTFISVASAIGKPLSRASLTVDPSTAMTRLGVQLLRVTLRIVGATAGPDGPARTRPLNSRNASLCCSESRLSPVAYSRSNGTLSVTARVRSGRPVPARYRDSTAYACAENPALVPRGSVV